MVTWLTSLGGGNRVVPAPVSAETSPSAARMRGGRVQWVKRSGLA
jgi:hypothetical protein